MSARASTTEPEYDVAQDDIAARMVDALDGASSLQLYQLKALIEGMLAEPRRTMEACASLHLAQGKDSCVKENSSSELRRQAGMSNLIP